MQGFLLQVDVAEIVLHEADDPNAFVDFLDADALTGKDVSEVDAFAVHADAAAGGDDDVVVVQRVADLGVGTLEYNNFSRLAQPGTGTLKVGGKAVTSKQMAKTPPMILQWDESFDIGSDTLTGVNDADYKAPFTLTAKLNS